MNETTAANAGLLKDLTPDECWQLAATMPVGRLAWTGPEGPNVVPVNFIRDGQMVRIRTSAYSAAARECDDSQVAFEVDEIDPITRSGWSVVMRGWAHIDFRHGGDGDVDPDVWAPGSRALNVIVTVHSITGRTITPS